MDLGDECFGMKNMGEKTNNEQSEPENNAMELLRRERRSKLMMRLEQPETSGRSYLGQGMKESKGNRQAGIWRHCDHNSQRRPTDRRALECGGVDDGGRMEVRRSDQEQGEKRGTGNRQPWV
jgi:hypothetical protein